MSSPPKRMLPASGMRLPASCAMKVVLPAPFGPITACVSPSSTSSVTPSVALSAPKLFCRFSTWSSMSGIGLVEDAGQAALEEDDAQDEERAEYHLPVLRPALQDLFQNEKRERAEH